MPVQIAIYGLYGFHNGLRMEVCPEVWEQINELSLLRIEGACYEVRGLFQHGAAHYLNVRLCPNPHLYRPEAELVHLARA